MTMRSPIVAMLWENWRLTRVEAAQRLGLGLVVGSAALVLFDNGATIAFWILILLNAFFWFAIARLNGGQFMDGYKPGFPLYLLYTRPVPTSVFVSVAMAYDAVSCIALYVISAAVLGFAFGQPLPLFSVALPLVAFHLACTCVQWSTRDRVVQWLGSVAVGWPFYVLLRTHVVSPLQVEFSLVEYALMVLVGVVSFGLAVVGVARQRRGDAVASAPGAAGSGTYPDWLVALFRFPCPTSSATRAQVWFELKSSGLPVLTIGLALALLIFLLFALSIPFAPMRHAAVGFTFFSVPVVLFVLGGNAFGIRRRQGRTYASAFEMTQPYGTAQLAGLKVLVRTACVLAALIAIGVSVWTSSSLVSAWGAWMVDGQDASLGLLTFRREIAHGLEGLTGYAVVAQAVVAAIAVSVSVVALAAREALRARYPRHLLVGGLLMLSWGLAIIVLIVARENGLASAALVDAIIWATGWIATAAIVLTTIYLFWSGFAQRTLTARYACGALVISAAFVAAWVTVLRAAGVHPTGMFDTNVARLLWSVLLLITMTNVAAPWSFNRIRHT